MRVAIEKSEYWMVAIDPISERGETSYEGRVYEVADSMIAAERAAFMAWRTLVTAICESVGESTD